MAIEFKNISPDHVRAVKQDVVMASEYDARVEQVAADMRDMKAAKRNLKKLDRVSQQVAAGEDIGAGSEPNKVRVTMYLSEEVIAFFKALGPGYQTRIDDTLKRIVREGADRWLGGE